MCRTKEMERFGSVSMESERSEREGEAVERGVERESP
jgi:hypothetical protein